MIRANSELHHELQPKYDDIILLSHKLLLSRLSPRHTKKNYYSALPNKLLLLPAKKKLLVLTPVHGT
jgi:hypothetical protein